MSARRIVAMVLVLSVLASGPGLVSRTGAQPAPVVAPPPPAEAQAPTPSADVTPARVSYSNGATNGRGPVTTSGPRDVNVRTTRLAGLASSNAKGSSVSA